MVHIPRLVILGRDGIRNVYREDHVKSPDEWEPIPNALEAVARLNHAGWHTVVATNQSGIGRGMIDMASINSVHQRMMQRLAEAGGRLDAVFFCPHTPEDDCDCRKPRPGLMKQIAQRYGIELRTVPMVADTLRDLQAAHAAGCEPHLVRTGRAAALTDKQVVEIVQQVPMTEVHDSLSEFVDFLLERAHVPSSSPMGLH
ncbi:MAG TPA: D-glycero-beta-D-manno-heptose 1,7-bisphosphate 7-phosphatase [Burkholderiaceae bacterium]|nr:D-glycero-beta-D-manno-heptose 1,7-bisphosphate 7-phosphatase [Burkholderiaceae bacterium]